jgi:hypothetical protein
VGGREGHVSVRVKIEKEHVHRADRSEIRVGGEDDFNHIFLQFWVPYPFKFSQRLEFG